MNLFLFYIVKREDAQIFLFVHLQYISRIYVRKSREKSFWKKNLEIKTLGKKSEFSPVLGKNVTGNKVPCFGFLGLFFLK